LRKRRTNLAEEIVAFRQRRNTIGGPVRKRLNGHGRLAAAGSDQTAPIAQEQVLDVVRAMVVGL